MQGTTRSQLSVAVVAIALIAAACSTADPPTAVGSDPIATVYLATVEATEKDFIAEFALLNDATTQSYSTRSVIFEAVTDTDFFGAAELALANAEAATPPTYLEVDHEAWLAYRSTITRINEDELAVALQDEDLQKLLSVNTKVGQAYGVLLATTSREFCLAATPERSFCEAGGNLPGGEYGREVYEAFRAARLSQFGLFDFPDALTDEESVVRLEQMQPLIEASLATARDALEAITPPTEYRDGHEAFVRFFTDQSETAIKITAANAARDAALTDSLYVESQRNLDRLVGALTGSFDQIAAPFFAQAPNG